MSDGRAKRWAASCIVATVAFGLLGCLGGSSGRVDGSAKEALAHNEDALERLEFGMSMQEAGAIMGHSEITPPWANGLQVGPQVIENPFDTLEVESPSGETYHVHRYATELNGTPDCPFIRGRATLAPLIYLDAKLVGWRWSYLESALQRPLGAEERDFRFGGFCAGAANEPQE